MTKVPDIVRILRFIERHHPQFIAMKGVVMLRTPGIDLIVPNRIILELVNENLIEELTGPGSGFYGASPVGYDLIQEWSLG